MGVKRKVFLKGRIFGKLEVLEDLDRKDKQGRYFCKCRCECGNIVEILNINLKEI